MKKLFYRAISLVLMLSMLIPLLSFSTVLAAETESELFVEDFSRLDSYSTGTKLTKNDGFSTTIPSTTAVQRKGGNTFLRVDIASGAANPNETVYYLPDTYALVDAGTEGALCTDRASYGLISGSDPNIDKNLTVKNSAVS